MTPSSPQPQGEPATLPQTPRTDADMGVSCPKCGVRITVLNAGGYRTYCEKCVWVQSLLCDLVQLLRGWHSDGTAWSEYDESVLQRLLKFQKEWEQPSAPPEGGALLPCPFCGSTALELSCVDCKDREGWPVVITCHDCGCRAGFSYQTQFDSLEPSTIEAWNTRQAERHAATLKAERDHWKAQAERANKTLAELLK